VLDQNKINTIREQTLSPRGLLINGQSVGSQTGETLDVVSPIDGTTITTVAAGTKNDTDKAIAAARASFEDGRWNKLAPAARKKIMLKWAELIDAEALELAVLGVRDNGTEISMALRAEPGSAAATIRYYAEAIDKLYGEIAPTAPDFLGLVHNEPSR